MKELISGEHFVLRIDKDESFYDSLNKWLQEHAGRSFWLSALGAAKDVRYGYYDLENREYVWKDHNDLAEIINVTGNTAWMDDEPVWHVHGVFAGPSGAAFGGHIKDFVVGATCEVFLTPISTMQRGFDEETGLNLLQ